MSPTDDGELDRSPPIADLLAGAAGGALGGLVPLALGDSSQVSADLLSGTTAGLVSPALAHLIRAGVEARRKRAEWAWSAASRQARLDPDQLSEALTADNQRLEVALRALRAASEAVNQDKIAALAWAVARTATAPDQARVDELQLIVGALAATEVPHIQVLTVLSMSPPTTEEHVDLPDSLTERVLPGRDRGANTVFGWSEDDLATALPGHQHVLTGLLEMLRTHGLVRDLSPGSWDAIEGLSRWTLTELGRQTLGVLGQESA